MKSEYGIKPLCVHRGFGKTLYANAILEYNQEVEDLCMVAATCCEGGPSKIEYQGGPYAPSIMLRAQVLVGHVRRTADGTLEYSAEPSVVVAV